MQKRLFDNKLLSIIAVIILCLALAIGLASCGADKGKKGRDKKKVEVTKEKTASGKSSDSSKSDSEGESEASGSDDSSSKALEAEKAKEKEEKSSDVYALRIVRDFIKERLDGDINKLRDFDLATLTEDEKYGKENWPKNELAKSIMALVFGNIWPNLTVDSINHYEYSSSQMVSFQNLFGSNILDKYYPNSG